MDRHDLHANFRPAHKMSAMEKTERAQKNWIKLKDHITEMRSKDNFLVQFLDEEDEMKQESIFNLEEGEEN